MRNQYQFFVITMLAVTMSCSNQKRDQSIKADLTTKARSEKDFAGVRFMVNEGVVTLNGECTSEKARNTVYGKVKDLYGVRNVVNNIQIAPVILGTDELLKQGVDSILKDYASVEGITRDSVVYLHGKIESNKLQTLTQAIGLLKPRTVENRLTVK